MHISLRTWDGTGSLFISENVLQLECVVSCFMFSCSIQTPNKDLVRCISDWLRTMKESKLRSTNNFFHTLYLHRNSAQRDIDSLKFKKLTASLSLKIVGLRDEDLSFWWPWLMFSGVGC